MKSKCQVCFARNPAEGSMRCARCASIPSEPQPQPRHPISNELRQFVFLRDGNRCKYCWSKHNLGIDHKTPPALGGTNEPDNLRVLCEACNSRKGQRTAEDYEAYLKENDAEESTAEIMAKPPFQS